MDPAASGAWQRGQTITRRAGAGVDWLSGVRAAPQARPGQGLGRATAGRLGGLVRSEDIDRKMRNVAI